jgi:hypothetical protein
LSAILRPWNSLKDRERKLGGRDWEKDCENDEAALEALRKEYGFLNVRPERISLMLVMRRWPINLAMPSTPL